MTTVPLCYYGSPAPLPLRRELRAGKLTAVYEAGDLRCVRCGPFEVARRWYAAIRDPNWGTIPGVLSDEALDETAAGFRVSYTSTHRSGPVHFVWRAQIAATSTGQVSFTFDGEALSSFRRNRIGFCILHPVQECAGAQANLIHPDGSLTRAEFPRFIAPHNPFQDLAGLSHELAAGLWCDWKFEGDLFETEDQRNWIDASFKTFCTPLRLPFPVEIAAGTRIRQTVTMTLRGALPSAKKRAVGRTIDIQAATSTRLPKIGLGVASHGQLLSAQEIERIRLLSPSHLQVELDLTNDRWPERLECAAREAGASGAQLELAIKVSEQVRQDVFELTSLLRRFQPSVARVLIFPSNSWTTTESTFLPAAEALHQYDTTIACYAGTSANFTELNQERPRFFGQTGVCYSLHPQEHAFDNTSLVETCPVIGDTVASVRQFSAGLPIAVGPITLRRRVNPYATEPAAPAPTGELPSAVDPRQMSLFGAGWTLGAFKYLAEGGVDSATFYETTGWRGVSERDCGCALPTKFPSRPRQVYPLFHVLADCVAPGGLVCPSMSSDPLTIQSLAFRTGESLRVLLANLTGTAVSVGVSGLGAQLQLRTLDETTCDRAGDDAFGFRTVEPRFATTDRGQISLSLLPYAYVRIDTE